MDKETVITHLQIIHTWASFARERDLQFFTEKHLEDITQWVEDALKLLKEQEVVRCKDCALRFTDKCVLHDQAFPVNKGNNWFCYDGEMR